MTRLLLTSLARISDIAQRGPSGTIPLGERFSGSHLPRERWATGDYVLGRVAVGSALRVPFELCNGRLVEASEGDWVLGALGSRAATLEVVGDWRAVGDDEVLEALTPAGLFGRATSKSDIVPELVRLEYQGHFEVDGRLLRMSDVARSAPETPFELPVVLIVGSSMSAGKTTTGRAIVRALRQTGRSVVAAKVTGAARYRDVLSLGDAGAEWIFDFVDVGLPSSICAPERYREALRGLLAQMAAVPADVAVIEAGASPLEPYNGDTAVEMLSDNIFSTVLCASDPYAVVGIVDAFGRRPDLVAGVAANTEAGIALVQKLCGIPTMDARSAANAAPLRGLLEDGLERWQRTRKRAG